MSEQGDGSRGDAWFEGDVRSVSAARRFVAETLTTWGAAELEWAAALLVTELATNAVIHAATTYRVQVSQDGDHLRIAVTDGSVRRPRLRQYGSDATTGRGLSLVSSLSSSWGCAPLPTGKTVWCLLSRDEAGAGDAEPDLDAFLLDDDSDLRQVAVASAEVLDDGGPQASASAWKLAA